MPPFHSLDQNWHSTMTWIQKLLAFMCLTSTLTGSDGDQPLAATKYGRVRGLELRSKGSSNVVKAFLGVPYAKAPVGDLRLALPQPPAPWDGVRDASRYGPACPQNEYLLRSQLPQTLLYHNSGMSEDCLRLDVYTPDLKAKSPVLVVVHGGGFLFGKSTFFINGTSLAAYEGIVVVSIQYRLGALGNLYSADGAWPSNMGLRDQQFALRWVQDNIAAFGGDPGKVTLNGEGAGGMSVSAHALASSNAGLFHRAIVQSGSSFTVLNTKDSDPQFSADNFAASLGCLADDSQSTLECIREKHLYDILQAQFSAFPPPWIDLVWDGDFLPVDPLQAYIQGAYSKVDYMAGVTSNEGFAVLAPFVPELLSSSPEFDKWERQLAGTLGKLLGTIEDAHHVMYAVLGDDDNIEAKDIDWIRQKVVDMLGECFLQVPTYLSALLHSDHTHNITTYFYECVHKPSFLDSTMRPSWHRGCDHGYDLVFIFGLPLVENVLSGEAAAMTKEEGEFSWLLMKYIANFVKTGNPNSEKLPVWAAFSRQHQHYQVLQPKVSSAKDYKADVMEFWIEKLNAIGRKARTQNREAKRDEL